MRRSVCLKWIKKYLKEISMGQASVSHDNPGVLFCRYAKQGKYNSLTDSEYNKLLSETEAISNLWGNQSTQNAGELVLRFLSSLKLHDDKLNSLAECLADCYAAAHGGFSAENSVPVRNEDGEELSDLYGFFPNQNSSQKKSQRDAQSYSGNTPDFHPHFARNPKEIAEYLSGQIYGQEEAIKAASLLLYHHVRGRKRNLLFAGPTGCGKTEIWRVLQKIFPSIRIIDSTALTMQGWSGRFKIADIFDGMTTEEIEQSIIVFDEFDKFCEPIYGRGGSNYAESAQNELLKLIEGGPIFFPADKEKKALEFDSSRISFVFCGSFETLIKRKQTRKEDARIGFGRDCQKTNLHSLYELPITPQDLVTYAGIRQEIAGRIHRIVQLHPMAQGDYLAILQNNRISPIRKLEKQYEVTIRLDKELEKQLAKEAAQTGLGVRYLFSRLQEYLDEQIFLDSEKKEYWLDEHVPFEETL